MATITTNTYLDDNTTNRTAGEAWTINGGILTIRTDTRWHNRAPAAMTGSIGATTSSATLGGGVLIDATAVRWMAFDNGDTGKVVPAIDSTMTGSGGGTGIFLGIWTSLSSAPTAVGAAIPTSGFIKFKSVSVPFVDNEDLTVGVNLLCKVNGVDRTGWIEVVQRQAVANTIPRLGSFKTRGSWFYLDNTLTSASGQIIQTPTNGGGTGTTVPAIWIEGTQKTITSASWTGGTATFTCAATHGFKNKEVVLVEGISPSGYNGERTIIKIDDNTFTMSITVDPGTYSSGGTAVVFDIYPSVLSPLFIAANIGTDIRNKIVENLGNGQVRIGYNGSVNVGYVPPDGKRVRIPNIIGRQSAAANGDAVNLIPNATVATRPDFTTTSSGEVDLEYFMNDWRIVFASPYKVRCINCSTFDEYSTSNEASATELDNIVVSPYLGTPVPFVATTNTLGGTIRNSKFIHTLAATNTSNLTISYSAEYEIRNCHFLSILYARATSQRSMSFVQSINSSVIDCFQYACSLYITTCKNIKVTDLDHTDRIVGTTNATTGLGVILISASSDLITVEGMSFGLNGVFTNVNPYLYLVSTANSSNVLVKNIGAISTPLPVLSGSGPAYVINDLGVNADCSFKRIYVAETRTSIILTLNTSKNMLYEHIYGTTATQQTLSINTKVKGIRGSTESVTGGASVYGTHFQDMFVSDTSGRIWLACNEDTTATSAYMTKSFGVGAGFTAGGQAGMQNVGDSITVETPDYILGHTSFSGLLCPLLSGTKLEDFDYDYKIDLNDGNGYSTNWEMLLGIKYRSSGGAAGQKDIVFADTGVGRRPMAGDYIGTVLGTNYTPGEVISSVVGTTITSTNNILVSMTTAVGIYYWSSSLVAKPINSSLGFKLKIRITAMKADTTNALTYLRMNTLTTLSAQTNNLYPLTTVDINLSNYVAGTRIQLYDTTNTTELYNDVPITSTLTLPVVYSNNFTLRIRAMYASGTAAKKFVEFSDTVTSNGLTRTIEQENDTIYTLNDIDGSSVSGITINDTLLLVQTTVGAIKWSTIYAYETYWLTTSSGIRDEGRFIEAIDTANYLFYNFKIKNNSNPSVPLLITGGFGRDGNTGISIDLIDTAGGTIFCAPDHVVAYAGGSGLSPTQDALLTSIGADTTAIKPNTNLIPGLL